MINLTLFLFIVIYIYIKTKAYYSSHSNSQKIFVVLLFLVHFSTMGIAYSSNIVDAVVFYERAANANSWISLFGLGTTFMSFLIYPLVKTGVSMFVLFMLFSAISYQAFLLYLNNMSNSYEGRMRVGGIPITQMFFLLPSLHFWSGFLGKDALVFFFLTFLLFEIKEKSKLTILHCIVIVFLLLLRPHVFIVAFAAFFMYYISQNNATLKPKVLILMLVITVVSILIVMHFMDIESFTYKNFSDKFNEIHAYASNGKSSINLLESSYLGRIWLLLFRPLFFDASTFYQYLISIENGLVLLLMFLSSFYLFLKRHIIVIAEDIKLAVLVGLFIMFMIASYIYNLGLASRMRLMFLPLFFYAIHQLIFSSYIKKEN